MNIVGALKRGALRPLSRDRGYLRRAIKQHRSNVPDCLCWIQPFGAHVDTILNAMTTEHAEWVIKVRQPLFRSRITAIRQKAIGLQ